MAVLSHWDDLNSECRLVLPDSGASSGAHPFENKQVNHDLVKIDLSTNILGNSANFVVNVFERYSHES